MKKTLKLSARERQVPPLKAPSAATSGEARPASVLDDRDGALLYELQMHQLEVESSNENLLEKQADVEIPRNWDVDLHDVASVGGFKLAPDRLTCNATDAARTLREAHGGARLLLVDDSPINCEVAFDLLRAAALSPDLATNGRLAVKMARSKRYDLILMDVHMPVMDGLQATRAIRLLQGCANLPIVAMSADAFAQGILACEVAGMNDFIAKPVDAQVLYAKLLKWLSIKENSSFKP